MACTTLLAGKDATVDGSTLLARNEDYGHALNPKRFVVIDELHQPKKYRSVATKCHVDLPDNPMRYTALPEPKANLSKFGFWSEADINAANVAMSATETSTTNSRVLGADPMNPKGIGEEDFTTIVLPYIHSAREGVQLLGSYLKRYGTYESNGIAFSDKNEVWYMETIGGHHWAAKRVPDDSYVVAPNWFTITDFDFASDDTMASDDLEEMISQYHLNVDGPTEGSNYNLRHIFGSYYGARCDSDFEYNVCREWYVQKTFTPSQEVDVHDYDLPFAKRPDHKLTVEDFKYALSSHYQRTPYDMYSHIGSDAERHALRPIGMQRNQELHILQIRNDVPAKIAGICWIAFGPNPYNGIAPYYANVLDTPAQYRDTTPDYVINNMYWLTHTIATIGDDHPKRYQYYLLESMQEDIPAQGRHIIETTDAQVASLNDDALHAQLQKDNTKIANNTYRLSMKALGEMVKKGTLMMNLNQKKTNDHFING